MNKEEIKEILEELENMYEISELEEQVNNINKIRDYIINLQQENKQLKDNWNKLKVYIKTEIPEDVFIDTEWFVSILDKMQEMEKNYGNVENNT